jgi:hypothetical protein
MAGFTCTMCHVIRYDNAPFRPLPLLFNHRQAIVFCGCCAAVLPSYQRSQHAAPPTSQPTLPCNIFIRPHDDWSIHHVHISNRKMARKKPPFPSADCEAAICGEWCTVVAPAAASASATSDELRLLLLTQRSIQSAASSLIISIFLQTRCTDGYEHRPFCG